MKRSSCRMRPKRSLLPSALVGLMLWTGCAAVRPEPTFRNHPERPSEQPGQPSQRAPRLSDARRRLALAIRDFLGAPYVWGGTTPLGVDCSGLVVAVYSHALDMDLPHSAAALYQMGTRVSRRQLRFGDLVFFTTRGDPTPEHVGIYVGQGLFVHASPSQGVVIEHLDRPYFERRWAGARRLVSF